MESSEMKGNKTVPARSVLFQRQLLSIPLALLVLSVIEVSKLEVSSLSRGRGISSNPLGIQKGVKRRAKNNDINDQNGLNDHNAIVIQ
jgi:hypothetical protein